MNQCYLLSAPTTVPNKGWWKALKNAVQRIKGTTEITTNTSTVSSFLSFFFFFLHPFIYPQNVMFPFSGIQIIQFHPCSLVAECSKETHESKSFLSDERFKSFRRHRPSNCFFLFFFVKVKTTKFFSKLYLGSPRQRHLQHYYRFLKKMSFFHPRVISIRVCNTRGFALNWKSVFKWGENFTLLTLSLFSVSQRS